MAGKKNKQKNTKNKQLNGDVGTLNGAGEMFRGKQQKNTFRLKAIPINKA